MADDKSKLPQDGITTSTRPRLASDSTAPSQRGATGLSAAGKPKPKNAPPNTVKDNWREIVETVVFVVVLVLLLKTFAAEAFVIPTGSMAETLYGYQKWVTCPQCDFQFPVNCSSEVEENVRVTHCVCPNCRYAIAFTYADTGKLVDIRGDEFGVEIDPNKNPLRFMVDSQSTTITLDGHEVEFLDKIRPANQVRVIYQVMKDGENRARWVDATTKGSFPEREKPFNPSCNTGDRVLVAKHLSDTHLLDLERFDVVVFKFPEEPQHNYEARNYIKRLIGLPGETIGIYHGNLYVANSIPYEQVRLVRVIPADRRIVVMDLNSGLETTLDVDPDAELLRDEALVKLQDLQELNEVKNLEDRDQGMVLKHARQGKFLATRIQLYSKDFPVRRRMYKNFAVKLLEESPPEGVEPLFRILRKSPGKVLATRRIVYDNNHQPRDLLEKNFPPRWAAEKESSGLTPEDYLKKRERAAGDGAWTSQDGKGFDHSARAGSEIDWLRYRHLPLPRPSDGLTGNPKPEPITDFIGYNEHQADKWVGDLILEFKVEIKESDGDLILELSKGVDRFQARWQLSTGLCTLVRRGKDGKEQELAKKQTSLNKPGTYHVRFANVDQRLTIWVDSKLPFEEGVTYDAPADHDHEDKNPNNLEPASIGVRGGGIQVHDLMLWRDIYYTDGPMTLYVQPGHYLCLGDNSPQSSDSRSWAPQRSSPGDPKGGLVPEELMLGRALLVYWPLRRAGTIK